MKVLVTGAAGFIGSHLIEALVERGDDVVGVDAFTSYYDVARKRQNVAGLDGEPRFRLVERDLRTDRIDDLLDGVSVVFHQAAQPGVRDSWTDGFSAYCEHNVIALQRLLEAAKASGSLQRMVFASSSSVYGDATAFPCREDSVLTPLSPYGVTKLAGEHLCRVYGHSWNVPVTMLRYFTVYGPRQRPDMAMCRLFEAARTGQPFPLYGDGKQERDFTFVGDVVAANMAAADAPTTPGAVFNIAGGSSASMLEVIALVEELTGQPVRIDRKGDQAGDVRRTGGDTQRARQLLGWAATVTLREGLRRQMEAHQAFAAS